MFTTRPDTLFGATYMVIAPDHPLTLELTRRERARRGQRPTSQAAAQKSDMERTALNREKTGVFIGRLREESAERRKTSRSTPPTTCSAPTAPARSWPCPAHDERDFEFAKRFELPIVEVVSPDGTLHDGLDAAFTDDGIAVRSGQFDGQPTAEMKKNIIAFLEEQGIGRAQGELQAPRLGVQPPALLGRADSRSISR